MQSCGAVVQNILLAAHAMGIGSCWVGELVENSEKIKEILGLANEYLEVMSIVALGYSDISETALNRKELDFFIV